MALHFEGTKDFNRPADEVLARLTDARFLVACVPGVEKVEEAEPRRARCVIRPGFAFVRGTLELTLTVADTPPGEPARVTAHSKGIGTTSEVEATLQVAAREGGSTLTWAADVKELGGLLKAVPQGLVKAAAAKVIADAWAAVETKMAEA
jgi:carbon monoxide dehydrogenase subunit G